MPDVTEPVGLRKWRRAPVAEPKGEPERRARCGGPELTEAEREEYLRQFALASAITREREKKEREEQEAREAKQRRGSQPVDDDEDEYKAAERFRNDRYAVGLLRGDDSAWGGGDAGSGMLG